MGVMEWVETVEEQDRLTDQCLPSPSPASAHLFLSSPMPALLPCLSPSLSYLPHLPSLLPVSPLLLFLEKKKEQENKTRQEDRNWKTGDRRMDSALLLPAAPATHLAACVTYLHTELAHQQLPDHPHGCRHGLRRKAETGNRKAGRQG